MTISAYVGMPGHGKSYGVVKEVIVPALKTERKVFTNIPINSELALERYNCTVTQFEIEDIKANENWWYEVFEPGAVLVIDEVQKLWPAGTKSNAIPEKDRTFLSEHRHLVGENGQSTEIILITQDIGQIATFPKALIETTFRVVKLSKVGMSKRYRVDVFFGPVRHPYPASKRDNELHGSYSKEVYSLYTSHTKSMTGAAGDETRIDKRFSILNGWRVKLFVIAIIVLVPSALYMFGKLSDYYQYGGQAVESGDKNTDVSAAVSEVSEPVNRPLQREKKEKGFLSQADNIYISWNNGIFPKIDYRLTVTKGISRVTVNLTDLFIIGYAVTPLSQCLVQIEGKGFSGYVMCQEDREEEGLVTGFVKDAIPGV